LQSNHARMTAAAAGMHGLGCELVLRRPDDMSLSGNLLLDRMLGARIHWVQEIPFAALNQAIVDLAASSDEAAYPIPIGGSSLPGAKAYAEVALELQAQLDFDLVVVANGSGGTHAGLAAGIGDHARVLGINVGAQDNIEAFATDLAAQAARSLGLATPAGAAQVDHDHVGEAYGVPTDDCLEALLLTARTEGLLLDPVYSGKAMAGLITRARDGRIEVGQRVLFVHTGGCPGCCPRGTPTGWPTRYGREVGKILSINLAVPEMSTAKDVGLTGINKQPVAGPVLVRAPGPKTTGLGSGVVGDHVFDIAHHGGDEQAVYAYAREDYDWWEVELGRTLPGGLFGENLTTLGVDVNGALIGEKWRIGTDLVLQTTFARIPCNTFQTKMAEPQWIKRFTKEARSGTYLRVVEPGEIQAGDSVVVVYRPSHGVSIAEGFRAWTLEPELLPRLLLADEAPHEVKEKARQRLSR